MEEYKSPIVRLEFAEARAGFPEQRILAEETVYSRAYKSELSQRGGPEADSKKGAAVLFRGEHAFI